MACRPSSRADSEPQPRARHRGPLHVPLVLDPAGQHIGVPARSAAGAWIVVLAGHDIAGPRRPLRPGTLSDCRPMAAR